MESNKSSLSILKSQFKITGYGVYLTPQLETAEELAPKINKTPQWILWEAQEIVLLHLSIAMVMIKKKELFSESDLIYLVGNDAGLSIASNLIKI